MRVLVTGATGFLGSHLVSKILDSGSEVVVINRAESKLHRLKGCLEQLSFYTISDKETFHNLFNSDKTYDAVIHAATCYGRDNERWSELNHVNVSFPLSLLEQCIEHDVRIFLNIDTALEPNVSAYALSKHHFVDWGQMATMDQDSFHFINVRLEHIYGPGDDDRKFVTAIIRKCLENTQQIPLTEGKQKRDFIYIDDAVSAIIKLLESAESRQISTGFNQYDVGSGCPVSIRSVVELIHHLCDSKSILKFGVLPYRVNECMESSPDIDKIRSIGWKPEISLKTGLISTIEKERHR